jgi:hypothetical protein
MKKFEILRELLKCDTDIRNEHMLLENGVDRLARRRVVTKFQIEKICALYKVVCLYFKLILEIHVSILFLIANVHARGDDPYI